MNQACMNKHSTEEVDVAGIPGEVSQDDKDSTIRDLKEEIIILRKQVEVAKFFVVQGLNNVTSRNNHSKMLDQIRDTQWALDPDVLVAATESDIVGADSVIEIPHTFAEKTFGRGDAEELWNLLDEAARNDTKVAFAALLGGLPFSMLPDTMKEDRLILLDGLELYPLTLKCFPKTTFDICPDIASQQTITSFFNAGGLQRELKNVLPSQVWSNRDFVLDWIRAGGQMHSSMSNCILNDSNVFLAIATAVSSNDKSSSFELMSKSLKRDKEFLLKLSELTVAHYFLDHIDPSLKNDSDILIAACAKSIENLFIREKETAEQHVKRELRAFEGFFKGLLCGIVSKSELALLDQGPDSGIKRNIASYLDFPTGKKLIQRIKAARNLQVPVFYPYDSVAK